jgi:threonine dehydrogenase-like Zn-dependent dehydrogenase
MKAHCWHGTGDVRVDNVPDPKIADPTDCIIKLLVRAGNGTRMNTDSDGFSRIRRPDFIGVVLLSDP